MKRILSMALALMLVLALVPTASALEIENGWVYISEEDSVEDLYTALTTEGLESIDVYASFTIDKDITIPEGVIVYFNQGVSVAEGVTVTIEKDADMSVYEYLTLDGTIYLNDNMSWIYLYKGIAVSGAGTVDGKGYLNVYDGNDMGYEEGAASTEVEYSDLGDLQVGSDVHFSYNLEVTADHLMKVTKPLDEYDVVMVTTNNLTESCDLVVDEEINVKNLYLLSSYYYDNETEKTTVLPLNLVVASGGVVNVEDMLSVGSCTVTVKAGGKLNVGNSTFISCAYKYDDIVEPAGKVTVEKGGSMDAGYLTSNESEVENGQAVVNAQGDFTYDGIYYGEVIINGELVDVLSVDDFTDIPKDAYYRNSVDWAVSWGITNGTSATTFGPDAPCTRAQVVTFLWRTAGSPAPESSKNPFKDVPEGLYYTDAVLWAVECGITTGVTEDTFQPDSACTRGQVVTFLHRFADEPEVTGSKANFTDVVEGAYYEDGVQWAAANGITTGLTETTFGPDATCNRAQIVTFLYRFVMVQTEQ